MQRLGLMVVLLLLFGLVSEGMGAPNYKYRPIPGRGTSKVTVTSSHPLMQDRGGTHVTLPTSITAVVGQVLARTSEGWIRGSCIVLSNKLLVTAHHVVKDATHVSCTVQGKLFLAKVTERDAQYDLAYVEPTEKMTFSEVATLDEDYDFTQGEGLIAYGYTISNEPPTIVQTSVRDPQWRNKNGVTNIKVTHGLFNGMSGGGLFTKQGVLVGVLLATSPDGGLAVPLSDR